MITPGSLVRLVDQDDEYGEFRPRLHTDKYVCGTLTSPIRSRSSKSAFAYAALRRNDNIGTWISSLWDTVPLNFCGIVIASYPSAKEYSRINVIVPTNIVIIDANIWGFEAGELEEIV